MSKTDYRTTFALDRETKESLELLAERWKVSKAEVVRKAIKNTVAMEPKKENEALKAFDAFMAEGGIAPERAEKWVKEIREDRDNYWERG